MVTDDFCDIVHQVFYRHMGVDGRGEGIDVIHTPEGDEGLSLQAFYIDKLADVAEVKIIDQGAAKRSRIPYRNTLIIVVFGLPLGLSGKLLAAVAGDGH